MLKIWVRIPFSLHIILMPSWWKGRHSGFRPHFLQVRILYSVLFFCITFTTKIKITIFIYMNFNFFIENNKSGYKTKENWFLKNFPDEYTKINEYCSVHNILSFKEKIWFFYKNLKEKPKCICGKEVSFSNRFDRGYNTFCSLECANNDKDELINRQKKTLQEKYNVDFYTQHKDFIKKQRVTKKIRYGDENYNNIEKMKVTKKTLYGDSGYNNSLKRKITNRDNFIKIIKEKTKDKFLSYELDTDDIILFCQKCDKEYKIYNNLFNYRCKQKVTLCTLCNPTDNKQTSGLERDICEFISQYTDVITKNRDLLSGKEIDILLPEKKIAVEFDGLYWHSDIYKDKNYHINKSLLSKEKGYDMIHIFEDEWLEKSEIIKSILKNKLNKTEEKIFARKCEIKEIDDKIEKEFLNKNHIQGYTNSLFCYGLYYNGEIVSLISFGNLRKVMGYKTKENTYEMLRYCNKLNSNVIGGLSKLFKHFIKTEKPNQIITYSDNRYFLGNSYEKLGFKFINVTKPNYSYVLNHKRYHRFKFRKDRLIKDGFDPNKTENEIMSERGYNRIWDCGNKKWLWG
jgi:hypothetical protein